MSGPTSTASIDVDPLFDIAGKVAIVTGASSGLGRQFAKAMAQRGAYVVAVARRSDPLLALVDEHPDRILAIAADVTNDEQMQKVIDRAVEWRGSVDIVV